MADQMGQKQVHQQAPPAPSRPPRENMSADALASVDAAAAGHQAALSNPVLNGRDAADRYHAHAGEDDA
jgi:hypothetical protein